MISSQIIKKKNLRRSRLTRAFYFFAMFKWASVCLETYLKDFKHTVILMEPLYMSDLNCPVKPHFNAPSLTCSHSFPVPTANI